MGKNGFAALEIDPEIHHPVSPAFRTSGRPLAVVHHAPVPRTLPDPDHTTVQITVEIGPEFGRNEVLSRRVAMGLTTGGGGVAHQAA
ncbi:hypothetical protein RGUI_0922 [Rhodovulum sp. P5]|nr:hypothetical protein RGUI_0922 [Rhodovulum sp. P5]